MWRRRENTAKGVAAGLIGGLVASWVMNQFQAGMSKLKELEEDGQSESDQGQSGGGRSQSSQQASDEERANVKAAVLVAEKVFHAGLPPERKEAAGEAVHYVFGGALGAVYGAAAEKLPFAHAGMGSAFGAALWFLADEVGVPAMHLSRGPREYPGAVHASALASHLVYGVTAEVVRRSLRSGWLAD